MKRLLCVVLLLLALVVLPASAAPVAAPDAPLANDLRISQIYGGGGNSGSTYKNDFIEIFNSGSSTANLLGWSVQYASATGTSWQVTNLTGSIVPGAYYLIQEAAGSGGTTTLPTPDATGSIPMGATAGKVALANTTAALTGACPTVGVIDFVGFGTTANCYEGAGPTPAPSNTNAVLRAGNGCTDTDNNSADFTAGAPTPRNGASATNTCSVADTPPQVSGTTPADGAPNVAVNANLSVTFSEPVTVTGAWFTISCNGTSHTAAVIDEPAVFTLNPDTDFGYGETCTVTVLATQVADQDGTPDKMATDYVFTFTTTDDPCTSAATPIHTVQGSDPQSGLIGSTVTVRGIVVGSFQNTTTGLSGFYIQEENADADPTTSEGIFVYDNGFGVPVTIGDLVGATGTVYEYPSTSSGLTSYLTELSPVSAVKVCSSGNTLPTPASLDFPVATISFLERFEGMRVTIPEPMTATSNYGLGRYGELVLASDGILYQPTNVAEPGAGSSPANILQAANDLRRIVLDDGSGQQNPTTVIYPDPGLSPSNDLRAGATTTNLAGVIDHRFGVYRIQPTGPVTWDLTPNPRPATPPAVSGTLKVVSLNTLNFFTTIDNGSNGARGADSANEYNRQLTKLVNALATMDADIYGLMELENNSGASEALAALRDALNAQAGSEIYERIDTGVLGSDAIRVGILYKVATVTPVGAYMTDSNAIFSRPPLAQTFEQKSTTGRFSIVVNHFKSKGCTDATGLDQDQGDGQSCYNNRRKQQATQLLSFINSTVILTSGDSDVLIVGDLNSYAREDPIDLLIAGEYADLHATHEGASAYSYSFNGQFGYLDYALANTALLSQVKDAASWHMNSDEAPDFDYNDDVADGGEASTAAAEYNQPSLYSPAGFRISDHDPVFVGLDLTPPTAVTLSRFAAAGAWRPGWPAAAGLGALGFILLTWRRRR